MRPSSKQFLDALVDYLCGYPFVSSCPFVLSTKMDNWRLWYLQQRTAQSSCFQKTENAMRYWAWNLGHISILNTITLTLNTTWWKWEYKWSSKCSCCTPFLELVEISQSVFRVPVNPPSTRCQLLQLIFEYSAQEHQWRHLIHQSIVRSMNSCSSMVCRQSHHVLLTTFPDRK